MNRRLLNKILAEALRAGDVLSDAVDLCFVDQETPIEVSRFQNPITDIGDIRTESIDASERIANLINHFGTVSDMEERYLYILCGIPQAAFLCAAALSDEETGSPADGLSEPEEWYIRISRQIQEKNNRDPGE